MRSLDLNYLFMSLREKFSYGGSGMSFQKEIAIGQVLISFILTVIGGWSQIFEILVVLMMLDYISGVAKGWMKGSLHSMIGMTGLIKKGAYLLIIATFFQAGIYLGSAESSAYFVRSLAIHALIINEFLSISENARSILTHEKDSGRRIPQGLLDILERGLSNELVTYLGHERTSQNKRDRS